MKQLLSVGVFLIVALVHDIGVSPRATAAELRGLGHIGGTGGTSRVTGLSADGSVVIGTATMAPFTNSAPFRWTEQDGMTWLGKPDGFAGTEYRFSGTPSHVSADGSVIVGKADRFAGQAPITVWTDDGHIRTVDTPALYTGGYPPTITAISQDGRRFAINKGEDIGNLAFIGDANGVLSPVTLRPADGSPLNLGYAEGKIQHFSDDGSIAIGEARRLRCFSVQSGPFCEGGWTEEMYWLQWTEGGAPQIAHQGEPRFIAGMTPDGQTIIAGAIGDSGWYVRTPDSRMQIITDRRSGYPSGITADGSTIVGLANSPMAGFEAWVWDVRTGMQSLSSFLDGHGLAEARSQWRSFGRPSISDDGTTIAGTGTRLDGTQEAYLIRVPRQSPYVRLPLAPRDGAWSYLDDGSNQGTAWRQPEFDDSAWRVGTGHFGYGDGDENTVVRFGADPNAKYATTYFRFEFEWTDEQSASALNLIGDLLRDDGAAVYVNGMEVYRDASLRPGAAFNEFANFNGAAALGGNDENLWDMFSIDPALLRDGLNVIAVEVHQQAANSSDLSFDFELTAVATTVSEPQTNVLALLGFLPFAIAVAKGRRRILRVPR